MALQSYDRGHGGDHIFKHSWRASYSSASGKGVSASYSLANRKGPAHFLVVVQTSYNSQGMALAKADLTEIYHAMAPTDDITLVTFDICSNVRCTRRPKRVVKLSQLLDWIHQTWALDTALWDAFCHACDLLDDWALLQNPYSPGTDIRKDNCYFIVLADGDNDGNGENVNTALERLRGLQKCYPFLYALGRVADEDSQLAQYIFNGEPTDLHQFVHKPGLYFTGDLKLHTRGSSHHPKRARVQGRARDKDELAHMMAVGASQAVKELKMEQLLPGVSHRLQISYS